MKFKCNDCGTEFEINHKNIYSALLVYCPTCGYAYDNPAFDSDCADWNIKINKIAKEFCKENEDGTVILDTYRKWMKNNLYEVTKEAVEKYSNYESEDKNVSHPSHYQSKNGIEVIDVIEAFTEGLEGIEATDTGNVIKYICRWKTKNGIQDLEKAMWYLQHLTNHLKKKGD